MTSLGKVGYALSLSLFRKTVFFASTLILPYFFGAGSAFWAEPICDLTASVISTTLMWTTLPKILKQRKESDLKVV